MTLVKTDVLDTDKVFTSRNALLDGPLEPILVPVGPALVNTRGAGVGKTALHDLGPGAAAIVVLDLSGSLGDVDKSRTGMLDPLVVEDLEAKLVTGLDGVGTGVTSDSAPVAAEVVGVDNVVGDDGVVRVAVLASVGILATDGLAVDDEDVEDVVGIGRHRRHKQSEESTSLHVGGVKSKLNICSKEEKVERSE